MRLNRLLLLAFAFYLTFIALYYNAIFPLRAAHHVLMTLAGSAWLWHRLRRGDGLPQTPLNGLIVVWLGVSALSVAFALDPRTGIEHFWFGLLHPLYFWFIVAQIQKGRQRTMMEILFFMAAVVVLISALELGNWYFGWGLLGSTQIGWLEASGFSLLPPLAQIPTATLAMSISTLLAGYTAPFIVLAAGWGLTTRHRSYRGVLLLLALLLGLVLLLTRSRGGYLSAGAALGIFAVCQAARSAWVTRFISPRTLYMGAAVAGIALAAGFVLWTLPRGEGGSSNSGRLDMWRSAVLMTRDDPLTGVGYGAFGRALRMYRSPDEVQDKLNTAHNIYLNVLSETGLPGAIVAAALVVVTLRHFAANYRASGSSGHRIRLEAVFAALCGLAIHSLVDAFTVTPHNLLVAALVAYGITPLPASALAPRPAPSRRLAWATLAVLLGFGAFWLWSDAVQATYYASLARAVTPQTIASARDAMTRDPALSLYELHYAYLLDLTDDPQTAQAYEAALRREPTWDIGWANLGAYYEAQGQMERALAALAQAVNINHNSPALAHYARLAEKTQALPDDEILALYTRSMNEGYRVYGVLPLSSFWQETPLRRRALEEWASDKPLDWQYRIWQAHDPQRLASLVPAQPTTADDWWVVGQHSLAQASDPGRAAEAFQRAADLSQSWGQKGASLASLALAQAAAGAPAEVAEATLRRAQFYQPQFTSIADVRRQITGEEPPPDPFAALRRTPESDLFASIVFMRPSLFDWNPALRHPDLPALETAP